MLIRVFLNIIFSLLLGHFITSSPRLLRIPKSQILIPFPDSLSFLLSFPYPTFPPPTFLHLPLPFALPLPLLFIPSPTLLPLPPPTFYFYPYPSPPPLLTSFTFSYSSPPTPPTFPHLTLSFPSPSPNLLSPFPTLPFPQPSFFPLPSPTLLPSPPSPPPTFHLPSQCPTVGSVNVTIINFRIILPSGAIKGGIMPVPRSPNPLCPASKIGRRDIFRSSRGH